MEEALEKIFDCITKQSADLPLTDYRDLMSDLLDEVQARYNTAETDLARSGDA